MIGEWLTLDPEVDKEELNANHLRSVEPIIVYARRVVLDSHGRYQLSDWMRTSFQVSY
ncbi:DUF6957 family protein [Pseudomonas asplenii]|uniref:DUF6957 family protein n=1 Tax=Pseudomonas asplenii TaxID=53407 RepID=UPI0038CD6E14